MEQKIITTADVYRVLIHGSSRRRADYIKLGSKADKIAYLKKYHGTSGFSCLSLKRGFADYDGKGLRITAGHYQQSDWVEVKFTWGEVVDMTDHLVNIGLYGIELDYRSLHKAIFALGKDN